MSFTITQPIAPMPAADWTARNPVLAQFEEGVESDTGKVKRGPGPWNDLNYLNPAGVAPLQMVTTQVSTNVGTKQALLPAVPAGKVRIVTQAIARDAAADLTANEGAGSLVLGWNAGADDWLDDGTLLNLATPLDASGWTIQGGRDCGAATEIFGAICSGFSITTSVQIDVFYYDVPA